MAWLVMFVVGLGPTVLALHGRRRAFLWIGGAIVASLLVALTVWALALGLACDVGAFVDAIVVAVRRRRVDGRWRWWWAAAAFLVPILPALMVRVYVVEAFRAPSVSMCPTLAVDDHFFAEKLSLRWRAPAPGDVVVFTQPDGRPAIKRVVAGGGQVVRVEGGVLFVDGAPAPQTKIGDTTYRNVLDDDEPATDEPAVEYEEVLAGVRHRILRAPGGDDARSDFPNAERDEGRCDRATPARMRYRGNVPQWPVMTAATGGCRVPDGMIFVLGDNRANSADSRAFGAVPADRVIARIVGIWWPLGHAGRVD